METGEDVLAWEEGRQSLLNDGEIGATEASCENGRPRRGPKKKASRKVSFPDDARLVRALDPVDPWQNAGHHSSKDVIDAYRNSCTRLKIKPCDKLIKQLEACESFKERIDVIDLRGVKLDSKNCEALEEVFKRVRTKTLDLENTGLEDDAAVSVLEMIEFYKSTWKLNLAFNNRIKIRGWQAVCRTVKKAACLEYLDIRNTLWTEQSLPLLGRSLRLDCCLSVLHMESTNLSGRPLFLLASAVKFNHNLKDLFLGDNKLISSDGQCLGAMLKGNQTLQLLDLRNNPLQDMGLGHISEGLAEQQNGGLQTLVLWNTQLTPHGMGFLANALMSTNSLQTLNLGHNRLTNEGIHVLMEGLLRNRSLQRIGLLNTRLSSEGMIALAEVIAESKSILRLDLRENDPFVGGLMALALALKINQSLVRIDLDKELKKEPGMETTQRIILADIYGYCQRNKLLAKEQEDREQADEGQTEEGGVASETDSIIHDVKEHTVDQDHVSTPGCGSALDTPQLIRLESPPAIEEELKVLAADYPGHSRFMVTTVSETAQCFRRQPSEEGLATDSPLVALNDISDVPLIDLSSTDCAQNDVSVTESLSERISSTTLVDVDEIISGVKPCGKTNTLLPDSEHFQADLVSQVDTPHYPGEFEKELDTMLASVTMKGTNLNSLSHSMDSHDFWTQQVDGLGKGTTKNSTPPPSLPSNSAADLLG